MNWFIRNNGILSIIILLLCIYMYLIIIKCYNTFNTLSLLLLHFVILFSRFVIFENVNL